MVGAPGFNGGILYVYEVNGYSLVLTEAISPNEVQKGDEFGSSISIDNNAAVIGAPQKNSVYAYIYLNSHWSLKFIYTPPNIGPGSTQFGRAIAITGKLVAFSGISAVNYVALSSVGCWKGSTDFSTDECRAFCPNGEFRFPYDCEMGGCRNKTCDNNQICTFTFPDVVECICESGYERDPIDGKCIDINECVQENECVVCVNTEGSYHCDCVRPSRLQLGSMLECYNIATTNINLKPQNISQEDNFGSSIAISKPYAFIGAPGSNGSQGSVYVFKFQDSWIPIGQLRYNYSLSLQISDQL